MTGALVVMFAAVGSLAVAGVVGRVRSWRLDPVRRFNRDGRYGSTG